ncbi:hypothetical protein BDY21DRAFT_383812 [Lineolata rhizophorae]|uniref:Sterol regulatory element-binding protein cleavage-activating protein n=1 Tax=Lineolata rhizophorae TaxID=578093 RepID=A0A6A6PAR2_9PEZI|nr:hypothetical protein BDY21DRAFT_383812 [Lineolata rhizophorae]
MIWYLLYPFRGTTEPPKLAAHHPIRRAFFRHGTATARHWLLSILLSVATGILLCYPALFLYDWPAAGGAHSLPHHVWTSARVYAGKAEPDIEMRQVWVHGSYMRALEEDVLLDALTIQDRLVGGIAEGDGDQTGGRGAPEDAAASLDASCSSFQRAGDLSWGFHSPLMYWNCSESAIRNDDDLLATINGQSHRRSFLNFTLRPTSVFAGKSFAKSRLMTADALVITLFDRLGYGIGEEWDQRCAELAHDASGRWYLYPEDGRPLRSQLYEFQIMPMSLNDDFLLAIAYFIMAVYVVVSLRKLRTIKSKFGLFVTVLTQVSFSLAFTPCDHSPLKERVGLRTCKFRLINAILSQPLESPTITRIANALGDVGHLSLAAAGQNLFLLWLLSKMVSPGVAAFCTFAAVAIVFDFVFHLTFFVAVLSVEVRRMELQDSLDRVNLATTNVTRLDRKSWMEAFVAGNVPFSSRIAGSAATICFILALNYHFFDSQTKTFTFGKLLGLLWGTRQQQVQAAPPPPPINQARTPSAWLRIQDHDTAKEVIGFVSPRGHSLIARVYDPLMVVLKDADRSLARNQSQLAASFSGLRGVVDEHFFPFALAVVFSIAFITLLMNYLLWNELPDNGTEAEELDEPLVSAVDLPRSHALDVRKLVACARGHVVSVGLDRTTAIYYLDTRTQAYAHTVLRTDAMQPPIWPIESLAIDGSGSWLAICTDTGRIVVWSFPMRSFRYAAQVELKGLTPCIFAFSRPADDESDLPPSIIIVLPSGLLLEIDFVPGHAVQEHTIAAAPLLGADLTSHAIAGPKIVSVVKGAGIRVTSRGLNGWSTTDGPRGGGGGSGGAGGDLPASPLNGKRPHKAKAVVSAPGIAMFAAVRAGEIDLFEAASDGLVHSLEIPPIRPGSLRLLHSARRACPACGGLAVRSLSVVFTESRTLQCVLRTYSAAEEWDTGLICLRQQQKRVGCTFLVDAVESAFCVDRPGVWETTGGQYVIGVRQNPSRQPSTTTSFSAAASGLDLSPGGGGAGSGAGGGSGTSGRHLRHRGRDGGGGGGIGVGGSGSGGRSASEYNDGDDDWEAWTLSAAGDFHTAPLQLRPHPRLHLHAHHGADASAYSQPSTPPFATFGGAMGLGPGGAVAPAPAPPLPLPLPLPPPPPPGAAGGGALGGPAAEASALFVARAGPVARYGRRSVVVGLGNAVKVVMVGQERFEEGGGGGVWAWALLF